MKVPVIPQPQKVIITEGSFILPERISISINSDELKFTADNIISSLAEKSEVFITDDKNEIPVFDLQILRDLSLSEVPAGSIDEAYALSVYPGGVSIKAVSPKGIYYGAMSLIQLINNTPGNSLQCMKIIDYPQLKIRGISDDISRGQVSTLENFKRIIKFISRYKMNTYMPYMEDMIQFKSFPSIGRNRGALSQSEIKEIIDFADKHYVEVIPIFQTLGHYENILAQEEFLKYAEFPGAASLNVSNEETYEFLETLLSEVFELFPSKYFHMGADESYDVGLGASRHLVDSSSIAVVHAEHYKKVYDICKRHGKQVLMYSDIILKHPEIMELIPKDIIMIDWHYGLTFDYGSAGVFNRAGFKYCVSPAVWNFVTMFPINYLALPNIELITQSGINNGALGMINSNWGDYGAETFKELVLYGYAWSAGCSWNLEGSSINEFNKIFFLDFLGTDDIRIPEIYNTLSEQVNMVTWHDVWRHPALRTREPAWWEGKTSIVAKSYSLKNASVKIRNYINDIEKEVISNRDHLNIISFICDFYDFYASKLETHYYLRRKLRLKEITKELIEVDADTLKLDIEKGEIENTLGSVDLQAMLDQNLTALKKIKTGYRKIRTTYYKEANLNLIEDKFERLINYFEEIKSDLAEDSLTDPLIASKWIYCDNEEGSYYARSGFKKELNIPGKVLKADLQLLGDTYAKLYINGKYVDEVYVRRSGSLYTESERTKYLDISDYIHSGENLFEVRVESFNRNPVAGFNLIAKIKTDEGSVSLLSDESWLAKPMDNDSGWQKAVPKPYRFEVVSPNFKTGRPGWIER